jgi:transcriptional regulator with XRE-family HTH domain
MIIGHRLRQLRQAQGLSQGDVEERTGLLRCYISRVENGHTVPSIETLQKLAAAYEVPLWKLFREDQPRLKPIHLSGEQRDRWKESPRDIKFLEHLSRWLERMDERDCNLLLQLAQRLAMKHHRPGSRLRDQNLGH